MGIFDWFSRGSRVAKGKANEAMDSLEDANFETTVKQSVRDMKADLRKMVNASADAMANGARLQREHDKLVKQQNEWKERAKNALQSEREDLAKKALSRSKEFEQEAQALEPQVEQAQQTAESLKKKIQRLKDKIRDAERTSNTLIARKNAAKAQKKVAAAVSDLGTGDNAFSTLKRLEENVDKDEAEAMAFDELASGTGDQSLENEIAALETSGAGLDDDLAALKAELK